MTDVLVETVVLACPPARAFELFTEHARVASEPTTPEPEAEYGY